MKNKVAPFFMFHVYNRQYLHLTQSCPWVGLTRGLGRVWNGSKFFFCF